MTAQGSFGVDLKITVSTTLTTVVGLKDVSFPEQVAEVADVTAHDSTSGYREKIKTGVKELTPMTGTINWDTSETTHSTILTAFGSDDSVNMSIADPDADESIAFAALITRVGRISPLSGGYEAQVEITPTGAPTIS